MSHFFSNAIPSVWRANENIDFFTEFLVYYEPLKRLDETDETDISSFFLDWFPRKAMWASESSIKFNLASFKKFSRAKLFVRTLEMLQIHRSRP